MSDKTTTNFETIIIDTGAKRYVLLDHDGDKLGEFKFHPSDTRILRRYEKVAEFFGSESFTNTVTEDGDIDQITELENSIARQFDFLLGYPVSEGLFGGCGALAVTADGDFYFERALSAIVGVIESTTNQRVQTKLARVSAATAKYNK